jgi:hypothetical protein
MRSIGIAELGLIIFLGIIVIKIVRARAAAAACGPGPRMNNGFPAAGFCTKCGQPLTSGGSFCPFCGSRQS